MGRSVTVVLGGREYVVEQQPFRAASAWRARLAEELAPLAGLLQGFGEVELNDVGDLAQVVERVGPLLLGAPETIADLLFAYSPALAAQREAIEASAYDDELAGALREVVGLAYPFGAWAGLLGRASAPTTG